MGVWNEDDGWDCMMGKTSEVAQQTCGNPPFHGAKQTPDSQISYKSQALHS